MSETKWTKGWTPSPWRIEDATIYALTENGRQNRFWCAVQSMQRDSQGEAGKAEVFANVSLIAAAPDLYGALANVSDRFVDYSNGMAAHREGCPRHTYSPDAACSCGASNLVDALAAAGAALAKARGETP